MKLLFIMISLVYRRMLETLVLSDYFLNQINQWIIKYSKWKEGRKSTEEGKEKYRGKERKEGKVLSAIGWNNGELNLNWGTGACLKMCQLSWDWKEDNSQMKGEGWTKWSRYGEITCQAQRYQWVTTMKKPKEDHSGWNTLKEGKRC